mmetsp:Transcript_1371/g.3884  ORF Transcript_1371/g.3884 Transcript_1371/m.3884 type:complete len:399 (-) Transcript_1371:136-1332(-)
MSRATLLSAVSVGGILAYFWLRRGFLRYDSEFSTSTGECESPAHATEEAPPPRVAFLGLGNMGLPMAHRLHDHMMAQHAVPLVVHNRTAAKAVPLIEAGAQVAVSVEACFETCDVVCMMFLGDEAMHEVVAKVVAVRDSTRCQTVISFATISPACASSAAEALKARKIRFVCAPVTGLPDAARAGKLVVWMSSASAAASDLAASLICPAFARHVEVLSTEDTGAAATYKLLTNCMIYGSVQLLAEVTALAERCGVSRGAVTTWCQHMAPDTFLASYSAKLRDSAFGGHGATVGAGLDIGIKDLTLVRDTLAGGSSAGMPTLSAALENMETARLCVGGADTAASFEWCVLAREVERRVLGFTSALSTGSVATNPRSVQGRGGVAHPAAFAKPTSARIAL